MTKQPELQLCLFKRKAKDTFEGLREYAATLERLLGDETAKLQALEALSEIAAKSRDHSYEPEDPPDEFVRLRDSFPIILRGSLLPYIHGNFEVFAVSIANLYLPGEQLPKTANSNQIIRGVNEAWPGTCSKADWERLKDYKHLRVACAHTGGRPEKVLQERDKVARAASRTPGASFRPYLIDLATCSKEERLRGQIEFQPDFLPEAITFHARLIEQITSAVITPPKGRVLSVISTKVIPS